MSLMGDTVELWPEVDGVDADGNPVKVPGARAVVVRGSMQPVSAQESAALGQITSTLYRLLADAIPAGAFAKVTWAGRDWDVVGEPQRRPGGPAGYDSALLRARAPESR